MIQMINNHKCGENKLTFFSKFFDVVNAFYCCAQEDVQQWHEQCKDDFSMCLSDYVLNNNICLLKCADKDIFVSAASGVLPGLATATAIFNWHYAKALRGYMQAVSPETSMLR
eukprot:12403414-Karenia_brevis.AAC.1